MRPKLWLGVFLLLCAAARGEETQGIPSRLRIQGGCCVVLGCGDGSLAIELAANPKFIIHGLDADAVTIDAARQTLLTRGLYGQITLEEWDQATLPYADNVVNLLVVEKPGKVTRDEMLRVVAPGGVICAKENGEWARTVKPRPKELDDWTHWRHGPHRNPVSKDLMVEVPRRIQWLSFQGKEGKEMVSAGGRTFGVVLRVSDEPTAHEPADGGGPWKLRFRGKQMRQSEKFQLA